MTWNSEGPHTPPHPTLHLYPTAMYAEDPMYKNRRNESLQKIVEHNFLDNLDLIAN